MHRSQPIFRSALNFLKHKFPQKALVRIDIGADIDDFIKDPDFLHYWRHVLPKERIAYLKGWIDCQKAMEKKKESQGTNNGTTGRNEGQ